MSVRDLYISLLEKRASTEVPDYHVDSAAVAHKEHESNRLEARTELSSLFTQTGNAGKESSATLNKLLPRKPKETSNPLVKLASVVYAALSEPGLPLLKTASPAYIQVTFRGFLDESEKIVNTR